MATGYNVAKTVPIGQLSESHAEKLIETREVADATIASIALDATAELVLGKEGHQLSEDVLVGEHEPSPCGGEWVENGSKLRQI